MSVIHTSVTFRYSPSTGDLSAANSIWRMDRDRRSAPMNFANDSETDNIELEAAAIHRRISNRGAVQNDKRKSNA
jgi:hypothetical protein